MISRVVPDLTEADLPAHGGFSLTPILPRQAPLTDFELGRPHLGESQPGRSRQSTPQS